MGGLDKLKVLHPRIFSAITKGVPILGPLLAGSSAAAILLSDAKKEEKATALAGLLTGSLGASGFAMAGAALGALGTAGNPIGALAGAVIGGGLGFFAGDYLGRKLAEILLGGNPDMSGDFKKLTEGGGGAGPALATDKSSEAYKRQNPYEKFKSADFLAKVDRRGLRKTPDMQAASKPTFVVNNYSTNVTQDNSSKTTAVNGNTPKKDLNPLLYPILESR